MFPAHPKLPFAMPHTRVPTGIAGGEARDNEVAAANRERTATSHHVPEPPPSGPVGLCAPHVTARFQAGR